MEFLKFINEYAQLINFVLFVAIIGWLMKISELSRTALADKQEALLAKKDTEISKLEKTSEILKLQLELLENDREKLKSEITESKVDPNGVLATLEIIRRRADAQVEEAQTELKNLISTSQLKEQELEKLQGLNNKLKEETTAREQILYAMVGQLVHRMRNQAVSIKYNAESLKNDSLNKETDLYIDNIVNETEKIFQLARLLNPKNLTEVEFETVSLKRIISDVLEKYQNLISKRHITLKLKALNLLPNIKINLSSFEIAITELIGNAISHTNENGEIIIEATKNPNFVELKIKNSVTKFNLSQFPMTNSGGGLYVAKKMLELNEGVLDFSIGDEMAILKITLPISFN